MTDIRQRAERMADAVLDKINAVFPNMTKAIFADYFERELREAVAEAERWISVEERLPGASDDSRYLVWRAKVGWADIAFYSDADAIHESPVWHDYEGDECSDITHWMPLPAPPLTSKDKEE